MAEEQRAKASALWRFVAWSAFWAVGIYFCVAVAGSVIVSLYGRPPAHDMAESVWRARQRIWCINQLTGLRDELDAEVTHELSYLRPQAPATESRWSSWRSDFENSYEEAATPCATELERAMADAYRDLWALYHASSQGVATVTHSRGVLLPALSRRIDALKAAAPAAAP